MNQFEFHGTKYVRRKEFTLYAIELEASWRANLAHKYGIFSCLALVPNLKPETKRKKTWQCAWH